MPSLQNLKGQRVVAQIPDILDGSFPFAIFRLVEIEQGGIWVESEEFTKKLLSRSGLTATAKAPAFFVPFAKIDWILSDADYPALSERLRR